MKKTIMKKQSKVEKTANLWELKGSNNQNIIQENNLRLF